MKDFIGAVSIGNDFKRAKVVKESKESEVSLME